MSKFNLILSRETHPQPRTVAGVTALVQEILRTPGAVERLVIEKDQPVRVLRWVERDPLEEEGLDLDGALRNAEMLECPSASPFETLYTMMRTLKGENAYPVCWVVSAENSLLRSWLKEERPVRDLLFTPVQCLKSLPREALVLAGAPMMEGTVSEISTAVNTVMEVSYAKKTTSRTFDRNRDHPEGSSGGTDPPQDPATGHSQQVWLPSAYLKRKIGG